MAKMQKQLSTQLEANEEFEVSEDLAQEHVTTLAEELHGVTDESLKENLPEGIYRKFFTPAEVLEPEDNDLLYEENGEDGNGTVTEAEAECMPAEAVKAVVQKINEIAIRTVERGVMEIGEYVFIEVFKGDLDSVG